MTTIAKQCEFRGPIDRTPCTEPAEHEVVWYLLGFEDADVDDEGNAIPRWAWLCEKHYQQLQEFHEKFRPTHEMQTEDGAYESIVPIGLSIKDVTVGRRRGCFWRGTGAQSRSPGRIRERTAKTDARAQCP